MKNESNSENPGLSKGTVAFGLALALASVVNGLLVVVKEKSPAVMTLLQKMTVHHWVSHAVIVLGFFALCGGVFGAINKSQSFGAGRLIKMIVGGVLTGGVLVVGFYLLEG